MEALGINLGYLLVQILNFAVLFVVLRAWVYQPLLGLLEKRKLAIAEGLENARVAAEARANAEREAEKILNDAQLRASEIVREATERAESLEAEIQADEQAKITKLREDAVKELEQERNLMLTNLRGQVVALAISAAQRLIGESLKYDEDHQHTLLKEFFSGVKDGRVLVIKDVDMKADASSAEVTSALPLTDEEKETVKQDVLRRLGESATITFRVDPSILGGLVIRLGDRMIDGSVAGQLQVLRENLQ